jgi:hypothetical protein
VADHAKGEAEYTGFYVPWSYDDSINPIYTPDSFRSMKDITGTLTPPKLIYGPRTRNCPTIYVEHEPPPVTQVAATSVVAETFAPYALMYTPAPFMRR